MEYEDPTLRKQQRNRDIIYKQKKLQASSHNIMLKNDAWWSTLGQLYCTHVLKWHTASRKQVKLLLTSLYKQLVYLVKNFKISIWDKS